nr:transposase [Diaphorobacter sp. JS3050]
MDRGRPHRHEEGFGGLAAMLRTALAANPFCGNVFVFLGNRGDILKVLWFDGQCVFRRT